MGKNKIVAEERWDAIRKAYAGGTNKTQRRESIHSRTFLKSITEEEIQKVAHIKTIKENNNEITRTTKNNGESNCFSLFDSNVYYDEDSMILKKGISRVAINRGEMVTQRKKDISDDWRTIILSLGGKEFRTKLKNLKTFPLSRLGIIANAKSKETIERLCDGFVPGIPPVIYFDRNPKNFRMVLDLYRSKEMHVCEQLCSLVMKDEFDFWGLDEIFLQPCCALKYFPNIDRSIKDKKEEQKEQKRNERRVKEENFGESLTGILRSKLWDLFEYPETSKGAQTIAATSMLFVFLSTITFILDSTLEHDDDDDDEGLRLYVGTVNLFDNLAIVFFTIEYLSRLLLCPNKKTFILDYMNLVDLVAILPFYISLILEGLEDMQIIGKAGKIIRLVRIMRILRIFKMVRHFVGLQSLVYTLHQAYKDLGLIMITVWVTVLMFSSLMFAFERDGPRPESWSFYDCIWWALLTLTTVGYHIQPDTDLGKFACGLCALCGVFIITLPIPIIVSSFAVCYRNRLWRNEIASRKRLAKGKKCGKEEILFNLATSSGMSGVRVENEILPAVSLVDDEEYEKMTVSENQYVIERKAMTPSY